MAEVLTQSQIDELLNSMNSGGDSKPAETKKAESSQNDNWKMYDFNSPKKFTKDRLKLLKGIYDNYGRLVSLRLNGMLRTMCEAEVFTVEEQRYFEFNNMLSDSDVMMVMNTKAPGDNASIPILFHIDQILMINMIDRMLGGTGADPDIELPYDYTEIEVALYEKVMHGILEVTDNAWTNYISLIYGEKRYEENPGLFQEVSLDEPVVIVLLNIKMGNVQGAITICVPGTLLMDIFTAMDKRKYVDNGANVNTSYRDRLTENLNKSQMEIKAKVGDVTLALDDILNLRVGDVIDLNKPKDSEVTLLVEEQPWFYGKIGTYNKNTAIQISRRIEEEEKA